MSSLLQTSLSQRQLSQYLARQLDHNFPDAERCDEDALMTVMPQVIERIEHCFSQIGNKYFFDGSRAVFDHLHGDQYAMFLYCVSHAVYQAGFSSNLAAKTFLLNKMLHGIDIYFEVELPAVFLFVHPLGTVLGRGDYSDYLTVYQRCGVGSNHDRYPRLGEFLTLRPGSAVYGDCSIGNNCTIAAESYVLDQDLADDLVYIGNPRTHSTRAARGVPAIWRTAPRGVA